MFQGRLNTKKHAFEVNLLARLHVFELINYREHMLRGFFITRIADLWVIELGELLQNRY